MLTGAIVLLLLSIGPPHCYLWSNVAVDDVVSTVVYRCGLLVCGWLWWLWCGVVCGEMCVCVGSLTLRSTLRICQV